MALPRTVEYSLRDMKSTSLSHEEISKRARQIWEQRGRPAGQENEHWLQAERELRQEQEKLHGSEKPAVPARRNAPMRS
jgi:hypothetical protein